MFHATGCRPHVSIIGVMWFRGTRGREDDGRKIILRPSERQRTVVFRPIESGRPSPGFTLIELMLVVIIIGALVAMVMPRLSGRSEQARTAAAKADVTANIATALKLYELDTGSFPTTQEGLQALFVKVPSATNWQGPYLEKTPLDPWGREYKYVSPGTHRTHDYDLYSLGRDGQESADDVANWQ